MPRRPVNTGQLPLDLFATTGSAPPQPAHVPDVPRPVAAPHYPGAATNDASDRPDVPVPAAAEVISAAVRQRVRDEFYRIAQTTGLVPAQALIAELEHQHSVQTGKSLLRATVAQIDDLVLLPGGAIASIAGRSRSPLTRYLRRMLAVCPGGLPAAVVTIQLQRRDPGFAVLTETDVLALASAHPDVEPRGQRIGWRAWPAPHARDELGADEFRIHQALLDAGKPLASGQIERHLRHHAKVSSTRLKLLLRESCVLVPMGDGTYEALQPSSRLHRHLTSQKPAAGLDSP